MVAEIGATKELVDIADKLGVLDTIKSKLVGSPSAARSQLAAVLAELSKIYTAIDSELSDYLSIVFTGDPQEDERNRRLLLGLEGGSSRPRIGEARGHCGKIWGIYNRYLKPVFADILPKADQKKALDLFVQLSHTDSQMLEAIESVTNWLMRRASETLDRLKKHGVKAANDYVDEARPILLKPRLVISESLLKMRNLEAELVVGIGR